MASMFGEWTIPTEFKIINPGQTEPFVIDGEKWSLKRYQDITTNARELQLTTLPEVPVQQFAEILAVDGAEIAFRGYVERYKKTQKESIFYCRGVENLLYHRFLHKWNYAMVANADGTGTFFKMVQVIKDHAGSGYPITYGNTDSCPGLLHIANSLLPWGMPFTVYDAVKYIIKYENWGTKSRMGTTPTLYYIDDNGVYPLTQRGALADLQTYDKSFYIDANDLYIRNTACLGSNNCGAQDYWYYHGRVLANNIFDTRCRIGSFPSDYLTQDMIGYLKTDHKQNAADQLFGIIKSFGLYAYLEDKEDATYIHGLEEMGLQPSSGVCYTIDEADKETIAFERSIPNKPHVHSLRGYGPAEQIYSWADYTVKGLWYEDLYAVEHGYRDANGILGPNTNEEWLNRAKDHQYYIKTARKLFVRPGDPIQVVPRYDPAETLPVNVVTNRHDGITELELNCKTPLLTNAWQNSGMLSTPYSNYIMEEHLDSITHSCQFDIRTSNFPACAFGAMGFAVPNLSVMIPKYRVLLNVSLSGVAPNTLLLDPLRYFVMITINGYNEDSIIYNYAMGDSISEIDVTNRVVSNQTNWVGVQAYYMGNIQGSTSCATQMPLSASVTMSFWNRFDLYG